MMKTNKKIFSFIVFILTALSLLGLNNNYWALDLISHFRIQYFTLSILLLCLMLAPQLRNLLHTLILVFVAALNFYIISPYYLNNESAQNTSEASLKIVSLNLGTYSGNEVAVLSYISKTKPDIIFFSELTPTWGQKLAQLSSHYKYARALQRNDQFGLGIISKLPIIEQQRYSASDYKLPILKSKVQSEHGDITLFAIHPFPPIHPEGFKARRDYLSHLKEILSLNKNDAVICGDFNTTPWSSDMNALYKKSNTRKPNLKILESSWPSIFQLSAIPIDFCLTKNLVAAKTKVGPDLGSDHYPIEVIVKLNDRSPTSKN